MWTNPRDSTQQCIGISQFLHDAAGAALPDEGVTAQKEAAEGPRAMQGEIGRGAQRISDGDLSLSVIITLMSLLGEAEVPGGR